MVRVSKGAGTVRQKAVILDFDGTIANTVLAFARVFEELTRMPEPLSPVQIKALKGLSAPEFMRTFNLPKWKVPYLIFRGRRMLRQHMDGIQPYAGIESVIKSLHGLGVPLYIVSSNSAELIQNYLKQRNMDQYFVAVSGGASPFAKARKLIRLADAQNIDIASSWCVGDETRDIIAAHAVGFKIASVSWGFNSREVLAIRNPEVLVDTPAELLKVLQGEWKK